MFTDLSQRKKHSENSVGRGKNIAKHSENSVGRGKKTLLSIQKTVWIMEKKKHWLAFFPSLLTFYSF